MCQGTYPDRRLHAVASTVIPTMKRTNNKRLTIPRETIRDLTLTTVKGGGVPLTSIGAECTYKECPTVWCP